MSQDQWLVLALKIVLVSNLLSLAGFAAQYQRLTRGAWRRDQIGASIMYETFLLIAVLSLTAASVFLAFNRLDSRVAAWVQIALLALVTLVMASRIIVFQREDRSGRKDPDDSDSP